MVKRKTNKLKTAGIAMVSVLFIGLSILVLVVTFSVAAMSENKAASSNRTTIKLEQLAEATSEQARIKLYDTYKNEDFTEQGFVEKLRDQLNGEITFEGLQGNHSKYTNGANVRWEVRAVSPEDNEVSWVDIAATAENAKGSQTVVQRIGFSKSDIFELAMLTETVNCMVCHLRVNGDVGTLDHFKPGWSPAGDHGDDNAGEGSRINGSLFAATTVEMNQYTHINGNPKTVNGAEIVGDLEVNSRSRKLPKDLDGDGKADFPPINRKKARNSARGSISVNPVNGAFIKQVAWGQELTNINRGLVGGLSHYTDGNVVLVGTADNPLSIEEDIFVEGDVIISGVVTGQGAIYAGRNIYITDNITLQNEPYTAGQGVCANLDVDACAKKSISDKRDTLRLGARGSIIIGDYTEYDAANSDHVYEWDWNGNPIHTDQLPWASRQNSDYFRSQFGYGWQDEKYFDTSNGDELEWREDLQEFVNVDGDVVASDKVQSVFAESWHEREVDGDDAYDYSFRPGRVLPNGDFRSWVSDEYYRTLLGRENYTYNSWREYVYWNNARWWANQDRYEEKFKSEFSLSMQQLGLSVKADSLQEIWNRRTESPVWPYPENSHVPIVDENNIQVGVVYWSPNWNKTAGQMRVLITADASYINQITKIDAFLYANQRIAGKTSMKALAIFGGMIAKDIGILAPGRRLDHWPWYQDDVGYVNDCAEDGDEYYVPGSENCLLTLNYDHRLRNGGLGYNLVFTETGKTLSWRTADSSVDRVSE